MKKLKIYACEIDLLSRNKNILDPVFKGFYRQCWNKMLNKNNVDISSILSRFNMTEK